MHSHRTHVTLEVDTVEATTSLYNAPAEFEIDAYRTPWTSEWSDPIARLTFLQIGDLKLSWADVEKAFGAAKLREIESDAASEWLREMEEAA